MLLFKQTSYYYLPVQHVSLRVLPYNDLLKGGQETFSFLVFFVCVAYVLSYFLVVNVFKSFQKIYNLFLTRKKSHNS